LLNTSIAIGSPRRGAAAAAGFGRGALMPRSPR
jgi:hypothetical protein